MIGKLFFALAVVAVIVQSSEAQAPAAGAIPTIWEDTENIGVTLGGIERMLGGNTRRIFDKIGYKYNTKAILENNLAYLLSSAFATNDSPEEANSRVLLQQIIVNLHPLSQYFY